MTSIIESVKMIYSNSSKKIALCDDDLNIIWKNSELVPDKINKMNFHIANNKPISLPLEHTEICEYSDLQKTYAVNIDPLMENDTVIGYIVEFYNSMDIEMLYDSSELLKYKNNFLGNIRTSLGSILTAVNKNQANLGQILDDDIEIFNSNIKNSIARAFSSTANYQEISKYNKKYYVSKVIDVGFVVSDLIDNFHDCFERNNFKLKCNVKPNVFAKVNTERLIAVMCNLIINAYMYNPKDNKECTVAVEEKDDDVMISVTDNGGTMTKEKFDKFSEPFSKFENYSNHESLGLATVNLFAETYNGKVTLDVKKDEYTKISLYFKKGNISDKNFVLKMPAHRLFISGYDPASCIIAKGMPIK